jgi:hypothetical protein
MFWPVMLAVIRSFSYKKQAEEFNLKDIKIQNIMIINKTPFLYVDATKPSFVCLQYYFQCFGLLLSLTPSSSSPEHKPLHALKTESMPRKLSSYTDKALQRLAHPTP